jgi:hypothetical protein
MKTVLFDEDSSIQEPMTFTIQKNKNTLLFVGIGLVSIAVLFFFYTAFFQTPVSKTALNASIARIQSEQQ